MGKTKTPTVPKMANDQIVTHFGASADMRFRPSTPASGAHL